MRRLALFALSAVLTYNSWASACPVGVGAAVVGCPYAAPAVVLPAVSYCPAPAIQVVPNFAPAVPYQAPAPVQVEQVPVCPATTYQAPALLVPSYQSYGVSAGIATYSASAFVIRRRAVFLSSSYGYNSPAFLNSAVVVRERVVSSSVVVRNRAVIRNGVGFSGFSRQALLRGGFGLGGRGALGPLVRQRGVVRVGQRAGFGLNLGVRRRR